MPANDARLLLDHAHDLIAWGEYANPREALNDMRGKCSRVAWNAAWMAVWATIDGESLTGWMERTRPTRTTVLRALCAARELVSRE